MRRGDIGVRACLTRRAIASALVLLASWVAAPPEDAADRLHLRSGGTVDVENWWEEGEWIYYRGASGTLGLPREAVIKIEQGVSPARDTPDGLPEANLDRQRLHDPDRARKVTQAIRAGRAALDQGLYQQAADHFREALRRDREAYAASVGLAVAELTLDRDRAAEAVILDGLALKPNGAELHELLGNVRNREERVRDALISWKRAQDLAPSDRLAKKIAKAERELAVGQQYDLARTSHFNLRYDGEVNVSMVRAVLDHLEDRYYEITRTLNHAPDQPITVQLFPKKDFQTVTQSADWVGGLFDGKIRVPLGGLRSLGTRLKEVLDHELTHAIVHSKSRGHAPWWLHEGLAQRMEGKRLRSSQRKALAGVEARFDGKAQQVDEVRMSYAAALGFTEYLEQRGGLWNLAWLLELIGDGSSVDEALQQVYGRSEASLKRSWQEDLREEFAR